MVGALAKAFHEKYGDESLEVTRNTMRAFGEGFGRTLKKRAGSDSLKVIAATQNKTLEELGFMSQLYGSDDEIRSTALVCPFGLENTSRELCEAVMGFDEGMYWSVGQLKLWIEKTLADGDYCCTGKAYREP